MCVFGPVTNLAQLFCSYFLSAGAPLSAHNCQFAGTRQTRHVCPVNQSNSTVGLT